MLVRADGIEDTIGGGALEFEAIAHARGLLARAADLEPWQRQARDFALGPSLGQCCGGFVRLLFELFTERERAVLEDFRGVGDGRRLIVRPADSGPPLQALPPDGQAGSGPIQRAVRLWLNVEQPADALLIPGRKGEPDLLIERLAPSGTPLFLYGAGHVGRALVRVLDGLPFAVTWIDTDAARFPDLVPAHVTARMAKDPAVLTLEAPPGAFHLVMTYSHPLDLAICHAVLGREDFGHLGLIGSETKRARFVKRLRELGHSEAQLARLICPIGLPAIKGKQPGVIAVAVAAQLLGLPR